MKNPNPHVSVFLLMEDKAAARDLSSLFREMGIIPHFFSGLKSFWKATLEEMPDLCIIDVKKMSDGQFALKEHPKVRQETLPIVFFFNESSRPLLRSTFEIFHLGVLEEKGSYKNSLRPIFNRVNKLRCLGREKETLQMQLEKIREENKNFREAYQQKQKREKALFLFHDLVSRSASWTLEGDFIRFCGKFFREWDDILFFSFLELAPKGQKLVSPDYDGEKYKKIPSLWLTQTCVDGMEFFAQNLSIEMAMENLGDDSIPLLLYGECKKPKAMVFLKVRPDMLENFPWKTLEVVLSGMYGRISLRSAPADGVLSSAVSPWELLDTVDELFYSAQDFQKQLLDVDFAPLVEILVKAPHIRFEWKKFYQDFLGHFQGQMSSSQRNFFRTASFGVHHMGFLVDAKEAASFQALLTKYAGKFPYENYLGGEKIPTGSAFLPQVRKLPLSACSYLKIIEGVKGPGAVPLKERPYRVGPMEI